MASPIILIELATPEPPQDSALSPDDSWLLTHVSAYRDREIFAFGVPELKKGPDLGRTFSDLQPKEDGSFLLELGVTLPDLLPNLDGKLDYVVEVKLPDKDLTTISVSNQMAQLNYKIGDIGHHAIIPRHKLTALKEDNKLKIPIETSPQLLRTSVTSRFSMVGADPEDALENGIESTVATFVQLLNRMLASVQVTEQTTYSRFSSSYDSNSFPYFYLLMQGKEADRIRHGKIAAHSGRVILNPPNCQGERLSHFIEMMNGTREIDDVRQMLSAAQSSLDAGILTFALLQMVIAGEMAVGRYVKHRLFSFGLSKNKWDNSKKEITYSQMLNIHLLPLVPDGKKPDQALIGQLNRARGCRNDLMHEGVFKLTRDEIRELYRATKDFIAYIEDLY